VRNGGAAKDATMTKVLERLDSAAGDAVSSQVSESVASLYHLKVKNGFQLRLAKRRRVQGGERQAVEESHQTGRGDEQP
jgi:hypothetical protein